MGAIESVVRDRQVAEFDVAPPFPRPSSPRSPGEVEVVREAESKLEKAQPRQARHMPMRGRCPLFRFLPQGSVADRREAFESVL